ncbi:MAG TPA: MFS transporter [Anaerolineales bacterium]|nr:MFS transporter [Anaerolineales bacterium]
MTNNPMRLRFQLIVFMLLRTILNTMQRMVYPFLAVFARGLGVEFTTISYVVTARSFFGIFTPILGSIADHRGRKFGMLAGILLFTLGMASVAFFPSFITFSIAVLLAIFGNSLFYPAMQAYFGDRIPYERRGTALAVTEAAWSLSFIVGIPFMGFLIATYGWSAPFPLLTGLGLVMFVTIWRMIPREADSQSTHTHLTQDKTDSTKKIREVLMHLPALAGVSIAVWASAGNEMVNLIFGVWLEDSFGLKIAALAGASAVIGISELSGEGLVALTTDRLGKPRALMLGLTGNAIASILLPIIGTTELGALIGLFLFYITFEYVVVSQIPLMTEVMPKTRATLLSFNAAGHSLGRAIGALLATFVYQRFGFLPVALTAILFNVFALLALGELTEKVVILPRILAWIRLVRGNES